EADSIVMLSALTGTGPKSMVISSIEHSAVHQQARMLEELGVKVIRVKPNRDGIVEPGAVADAIRPDTVIVAVMAVNNETGAIQPTGATSAAIKLASGSGREPFFHCDAVQALGKIPFDVDALGVDGAAFSAHKLGGPRGVGALYLRRTVRPLVQGGGQENGMRSGTQNTAGAWAFSKAAERSEESLEAGFNHALKLEAMLLDGIRSIPGATVIPQGRTAGDPRWSPYIACVGFPGLGGETMARLLDDEGIWVSTGAACSGAKKERRVLDAMGVDRELSFSSIRVSTGRDSTEADIVAFLEHAGSCYARFRT
ncbi:MAG: cysteine desulfurase, partial [Spirochaetae bacterium HGW-Spirochaetae-7]